jgi:hypothetical protein
MGFIVYYTVSSEAHREVRSGLDMPFPFRDQSPYAYLPLSRSRTSGPGMTDHPRRIVRPNAHLNTLQRGSKICRCEQLHSQLITLRRIQQPSSCVHNIGIPYCTAPS